MISFFNSLVNEEGKKKFIIFFYCIFIQQPIYLYTDVIWSRGLYSHFSPFCRNIDVKNESRKAARLVGRQIEKT
jgi:hypothetical protein